MTRARGARAEERRALSACTSHLLADDFCHLFPPLFDLAGGHARRRRWELHRHLALAAWRRRRDRAEKAVTHGRGDGAGKVTASGYR
jgi:hypothetical protein